MEEMESTRRLMALELDDRAGRRALLDDAEWIAQFERDWYRGKRGRDLPRLLAKLGMPMDNFTRELGDMMVERCPIPGWAEQSLQAVYERLQAFQASSDAGAGADDAERAFFAACPAPIGSDAAFFLHLLRRWDKQLRWRTVVANRDAARIRELLFDRHTLPGFNDSGAHLNNLSFYDGNLLTLKIAAQESTARVAEAVRRLTRDPARFFGLDCGTLAIGAQADLTLVDPIALAAYDSDAGRALIWREDLQAEQLVNRSDGVVSDVFIAGQAAWENGATSAALGKHKMGRALTFAGRA
jgi:N-acyl-D-aspartate/D-glutamate deacylase